MLESIRVFVKVSECGSFSKAARVLKMAPSSVSRRLDKLERELGTNLLKRSTRQLTLTDNGEVFLKQAVALLEEANGLRGLFKESDSEPSGELRISVFESFSQKHLSPALPEFLQRYPKLSVDLRLESRLVNLALEDVDIAIRIGRPANSSLRYRKLTANDTALCASPRYFQQHGKPNLPEDLSRHNCLRLRPDRQRSFWYFRQGPTSTRVAIEGNLSSPGGGPLMEAAKQGMGIVQLPRWMIADALVDKSLECCLEDWTSSLYEASSGEVYLVYRQTLILKPAIRAFIDFLSENMTALKT